MNKQNLNQEKIELNTKIRTGFIDSKCKHPLYELFVSYIDNAQPDHEHYIRYCHTMAAILNNSIFKEGDIICDTGRSLVLDFLSTVGFDTSTTGSDLRYQIDRGDNSIDVFLSLEVIEHIKDQESKNLNDIVLWNKSGVKKYVEEIYRVLKPGGLCVLTTPNPCSAIAALRLVQGDPPMVFRRHVREYTDKELREAFDKFDIVHYEQFFCFFLLGEARRQKILTEKFGSSATALKVAGDDHFFLFRKPV